jgi:Domain of unknown function (DUF4345)
MPSLLLTLKLLAPVFFVIAAMHLVFGLDAEAMLGAQVSTETAMDPTLNSQNKFYGVAFALYGVILYMSALDLVRYAPILKASMLVFFAAGVSRLVSFVVDGPPSLPVALLAGVELVAPWVLLFWVSRAKVSA